LRKLLLLATSSALIVSLAACGSSGSDDADQQTVPESAVGEPSIVRTTEFFGNSGNLYKPAGEEGGSGAGLVVILLGPHHTEQFDSCEIKKSDGTVAQLDCNNRVPWTHQPYSCFANGNRQHWRADFSCWDVGDVKVTCKKPGIETVFTVPDEVRAGVCSRWG
jgi:hypothetical protein